MADNPTFDWAQQFLNNSPVNTPTWAGYGPGAPANNTNRDFSDTMARLFLQLTADEATALQSASGELALVTSLAGQGNGQGSYGYINFLMQSASHSLREVLQVVETLDDLYSGYSFGQQPPTFQYSVALINNKQDAQAHKMFKVYREILRSNRLAHNKMICHLSYDGYLVSGYLTGFTWQLQAADESMVSAQFEMLVKGVQVSLTMPTGNPTITGNAGFSITATPAATSTGVRTQVDTTATAPPAPPTGEA